MGNAQGADVGEQEITETERALHVQKMGTLMRRKLRGSGAQYNMKILIRGERGSGKTALWCRLQDLRFEPAYVPTPEIQTGTISWAAKSSDEVVKVEVWDVVDHAMSNVAAPEKDFPGMPSVNESRSDGISMQRKIAALDASVLDVYQGTQVVIFMINPSLAKSFSYVSTNISNVPDSVSIVILYNFWDLVEASEREKDSREILKFEDVQSLTNVRNKLDKSRGCDRQTYAFPCSMSTCFGLKVLYNYINVPFLRMKKDVLHQQLLIVDDNLKRAKIEVDQLIGEQSYKQHMMHLKGVHQVQSESLRSNSSLEGKRDECVSKTDDIPGEKSIPDSIDEEEKEALPVKLDVTIDPVGVSETVQIKKEIKPGPDLQEITADTTKLKKHKKHSRRSNREDNIEDTSLNKNEKNKERKKRKDKSENRTETTVNSHSSNHEIKSEKQKKASAETSKPERPSQEPELIPQKKPVSELEEFFGQNSPKSERFNMNSSRFAADSSDSDEDMPVFTILKRATLNQAVSGTVVPDGSPENQVGDSLQSNQYEHDLKESESATVHSDSLPNNHDDDSPETDQLNPNQKETDQLNPNQKETVHSDRSVENLSETSQLESNQNEIVQSEESVEKPLEMNQFELNKSMIVESEESAKSMSKRGHLEPNQLETVHPDGSAKNPLYTDRLESGLEGTVHSDESAESFTHQPKLNENKTGTIEKSVDNPKYTDQTESNEMVMVNETVQQYSSAAQPIYSSSKFDLISPNQEQITTASVSDNAKFLQPDRSNESSTVQELDEISMESHTGEISSNLCEPALSNINDSNLSDSSSSIDDKGVSGYESDSDIEQIPINISNREHMPHIEAIVDAITPFESSTIDNDFFASDDDSSNIADLNSLEVLSASKETISASRIANLHSTLSPSDSEEASFARKEVSSKDSNDISQEAKIAIHAALNLAMGSKKSKKMNKIKKKSSSKDYDR